MKKLFSFILVLLLTIFCIISVSALEISNPSSANVELNIQINPTYIVVIPDDTYVSYNSEFTDFQSVKLIQANLEPNKFILVELKADKMFVHVNNNLFTIPFTVVERNNKKLLVNDIVLYKSNDEKKLSIHVEPDEWNYAKAGKYEATVNFNISYTSLT